MGMLGTVMNCLALQDFLEQAGVETRVQSAITMGQVAEAYIPRRAIRHMEKGRVVIFGAGAGLPYFSTDTVAAQRAMEVHADVVLMAKSGVDGVYTADPKKDPTAEKLHRLSYDDALRRDIRVMDQTAMTMCKDNNLTMVVFGMEGEGNVTRAIRGERPGHRRHPLATARMFSGHFRRQAEDKSARRNAGAQEAVPRPGPGTHQFLRRDRDRRNLARSRGQDGQGS